MSNRTASEDQYDLEHLRFMLRKLLRCANRVDDGDLIGMVRYIRDGKAKAEAQVREYETRLLRYNVPLTGPLPPADDE